MALDIQGLSARYAVRRLTEADLPEQRARPIFG